MYEKCFKCLGSCDLFEEQELKSLMLNKTFLRSEEKMRNEVADDDNTQDEDDDGDDDPAYIDKDFFCSNTICAIACDANSLEMFYFV